MKQITETFCLIIRLIQHYKKKKRLLKSSQKNSQQTVLTMLNKEVDTMAEASFVLSWTLLVLNAYTMMVNLLRRTQLKLSLIRSK